MKGNMWPPVHWAVFAKEQTPHTRELGHSVCIPSFCIPCIADFRLSYGSSLNSAIQTQLSATFWCYILLEEVDQWDVINTLSDKPLHYIQKPENVWKQCVEACLLWKCVSKNKTLDGYRHCCYSDSSSKWNGQGNPNYSSPCTRSSLHSTVTWKAAL